MNKSDIVGYLLLDVNTIGAKNAAGVTAYYVDKNGVTSTIEIEPEYKFGLRPAMWLDFG